MITVTKPVNRVRYQQFVRQARGLEVNELHVNRVDKRSAVLLQYNGRSRKGKQRLTGQWTIDRVAKGETDEKTDEQLAAEIKEFLAMARKDFYVRRGEGLSGDAYADAQQEQEATPIKEEK